MAVELVYTSAPQGLKANSRGFCVVQETAGLPPNLARVLESACGYRHLGPPGSSENPVTHAHLLTTVGGQRWHLVGRLADAGRDYTGRTNKLCHWVAFPGGEMPSAGPSWLLKQSQTMMDAWDGQCRQLPPKSLPGGQQTPRVCQTWKTVTGDAGWGGVLAESGLQNREAWIVVSEIDQALPLIDEALSLLPPDRRATISFSTFFIGLPKNVECLWKVVLVGSDEARAAKRHARALHLDLTKPPGPATGGELVEVARTGRTSTPAPPSKPIAKGTQAKSLPSFERFLEEEEDVEPYRLADADELPGRRVTSESREHGNRMPPPPPSASGWPLKWIILPVALLILVAAGGVGMFAWSQFGSDDPGDGEQVAKTDPVPKVPPQPTPVRPPEGEPSPIEPEEQGNSTLPTEDPEIVKLEKQSEIPKDDAPLQTVQQALDAFVRYQGLKPTEQDSGLANNRRKKWWAFAFELAERGKTIDAAKRDPKDVGALEQAERDVRQISQMLSTLLAVKPPLGVNDADPQGPDSRPALTRERENLNAAVNRLKGEAELAKATPPMPDPGPEPSEPQESAGPTYVAFDLDAAAAALDQPEGEFAISLPGTESMTDPGLQILMPELRGKPSTPVESASKTKVRFPGTNFLLERGESPQVNTHTIHFISDSGLALKSKSLQITLQKSPEKNASLMLRRLSSLGTGQSRRLLESFRWSIVHLQQGEETWKGQFLKLPVSAPRQLNKSNVKWSVLDSPEIALKSMPISFSAESISLTYEGQDFSFDHAGNDEGTHTFRLGVQRKMALFKAVIGNYADPPSEIESVPHLKFEGTDTGVMLRIISATTFENQLEAVERSPSVALSIDVDPNAFQNSPEGALKKAKQFLLRDQMNSRNKSKNQEKIRKIDDVMGQLKQLQQRVGNLQTMEIDSMRIFYRVAAPGGKALKVPVILINSEKNR